MFIHKLAAISFLIQKNFYGLFRVKAFLYRKESMLDNKKIGEIEICDFLRPSGCSFPVYYKNDICEDCDI